MVEITFIEAKLLISQLDEELSYKRRIMDNILSWTSETRAIADVPGGKEETERTSGPNEAFQLQTMVQAKKAMDDIQKEMDVINERKNKIETAMWRFKSTQTFTY